MPVEYLIREGTAFECVDGDRVDYNVVGTVPKVGFAAPDFTLHRYDPTKRAIVAVSLADFEGPLVIYGNNSPFTPVCREGAAICNSRLIDTPLPDGVTFIAVSFDEPENLEGWALANQINYPMVSSLNSPFGYDYGIYMQDPHHPENEGMIQRSLIVISGKNPNFPNGPREIVYMDVVEDQGGPQPDFEAGFAAIEEARAVHIPPSKKIDGTY